MAEEAFALSPISARAAQPSEEDYAAIHEAFMETSRGRWFLGEYAKRNRNADTRMVLDAVARIEGSLAAQKQAAAEASLTTALAAIRAAVGEAQVAASTGLDGVAFEELLAPVARAVRIIREISWRWRETGADSRICDILDSQTSAIEASAGRISVAEARATIDRAFAAIEARIDEYWPGEAAPAEARRAAEDANVVPFPAPTEETAVPGAAAPAATVPEPEPPVGELAEPAAAEVAESSTAYAAEPAAGEPIADVVGAVEFVDETVADAHDEAVLDLIAAEMSAPQPADDDITLAVAEPVIAEAVVAEPAMADSELADSMLDDTVLDDSVLDMAEAVTGPVAEAVAAPVVQPEAPAVAMAASQPAHVGEASIGSAVIASGILTKPKLPANDALAPIRRMSQAERIAFFS